jgi:hypothetical protein
VLDVDRRESEVAMRNRLLALVLTVVVSACSSARGFDRGALDAILASEATVTDEDVERVLALKPQLPRPFKLGIFLKQPSAASASRLSPAALDWSWLPADKDALLRVGAALEEDGLVAQTVLVGGTLVEGEDLRSIRLAAARHGVDAVLVVSGVADVDRYNNGLAATYVLLVTPFFVPGTVVDGIFVAHAALWDVRNEYLYAAVEADGSASETRPAVLAREETVIALAKKRALATLVEATTEHIARLGG